MIRKDGSLDMLTIKMIPIGSNIVQYGRRRKQIEGTPEEDIVDGVKEDTKRFVLF